MTISTARWLFKDRQISFRLSRHTKYFSRCKGVNSMLLRNARIASLLILFFLITDGSQAQKKQKASDVSSGSGTPVLWEPFSIADRDLFLGPGGREMMPDLSKITFVSDDKTGHALKYKIKDGADRSWTAKIDLESQSETAALRLLWALGYKT